MTQTATQVPVYEAIAGVLIDAGVETAFGLMGEDTAKLVTHLSAQPGFSYHAARHEQMAVAMADGYARMSGGLGVAVLSRGPGLVNGLTAAIAARKRGTPLLIVAGDTPTGERVAGAGARYPKHARQTAIVEACDLVSETIGAADQAGAVTRAAIARATQGAVVTLNVPTDLFGVESGGTDHVTPADPADVSPPLASAGDVAAVAAVLDASERPVLLAGDGAVQAGAREAIMALAERTGALLATSLLGKDLFAESDWDLGIVGGFAGEVTRSLIRDADLVVAFGASLNKFTSGGGKLLSGARVVHIDIDPDELGASTPIELGVVADARVFAEALREEVVPGSRWRTGTVRTAIAADKRRADFDDRSSHRAVDPRTALKAIDAALPADRGVIVDAGAFSGFVSRYVSVAHPSRFAFCLDFSAVGLAHGTSIGAAAGLGGSTAALFIGDGGLLLTLGELETTRRTGANLVIVVLDDGAYGAERHYLDIVGLPIDDSVFGMVDFAGIATAIGIDAVRVEDVGDLDAAARAIAGRTGPLLVDVKIDGAIRPLWLEELYTDSSYGR